ncbi:hypothetical protein ACU635_36295 [[Actinomadura] parvosata]|uniref:hypothetical protein n=1 Tax=[Actinomadura] parvosata TaxID=1955412 RepID=UPI00406CEBFE
MRVRLPMFARRWSSLDARLLDGALALALTAGTWLWEVLEPGKGRPTPCRSG